MAIPRKHFSTSFKLCIILASLLNLNSAFQVGTRKTNNTKNVEGHQDIHLECIDTLSDFQAHNWTSNIEGSPWPMGYAETPADLPAELAGLDGHGIFWVPAKTISNPYLMKLDFPERTLPAFLYVKYYAVNQSNSSLNHVFSSKIHDDTTSCPSCKVLPRTTGWVWGEELVELDYTRIGEGLGLNEATSGDLMAAEKIIVVKGKHFSDLEDVKALCGWANKL